MFFQTTRFSLHPVLKGIIAAIIFISLATFTWDVFFPGTVGPAVLLPLSYFGVKKFFFWQIFTYLFVQPLVSVGHCINLLLVLYLLYTVGTAIIEIKGPRDFVVLFFGGAFISGAVTALSMVAFPTMLPFAGPVTALYALITAWIFLFPEADMFLFLTFPMKARFLFFIVTAIGLISDISERQFAFFFGYLAPIIFAYSFSLLRWELMSPFPFLHRFEYRLIRLKHALFSRKATAHAFSSRAKVYDFKTGEAVLSDAEFIEACQVKIARMGKSSLTLAERWRLFKIQRGR